MRNLSQDIASLRNSSSPVVQLLSRFLEDVITAVGESTISRYEIPDFSDLYVGGKGSMRIRLVGIGDLGSVALAITSKGYYLIYAPTTDEKQDVRLMYEGFQPANPNRFTVDDRLAFFEIKMEDENIVAKPIVSLSDNREPMSGGRIAYEPLNSTHPDCVSKIAERMKLSLAGEVFELDRVEFSRSKPAESDQSF